MKWINLLIIQFVYIISAQFTESPCPSYFEYATDGNSIYGLIHLYPNGPVNSLLLRANFTISGHLGTNDVGSLEPIGTNLLQNQYNNGHRISFRVRFPPRSALPKLTSLTVNDNIICFGQGDIPTTTHYVTTLSLRNLLHLKTGFIQGLPPPVVTEPPDNIKKHLYDIIKQKFNSSQNNPQFEVTVIDLPNLNNNGVVYQNEGQLIQSYLQQNLNPSKNQNKPIYPTNQNRPYHPGQKPVYQNQNKPQYEDQEFLIIEAIPDSDNQFPQKDPSKVPDNNPPKRPDLNQVVPKATTQSLPATTQSLPATTQSMPATTTTTTTKIPPALVDRTPELTTQRPNEGSSDIQCGVSAGGNTRVPLIYNGESFSKGDWPWLVAIYKRKDGGLNFICSGTLVSDRHVITAAHCMQTKSTYLSIRDIVVKVGVYNLEDWGDDFIVTRTLASAAIHESYNSSTLANDILVVTFDKRVQFSVNIRPACLWTGSSDLNKVVGSSGVVTGWGQSELGAAGRGEPRMVRMPIVSTATCRASKPDFHKLTSAYTLCAGDRNGAGPCLGDSGAGLYLLDNGQWRLRGVVSLSLRAESGDHSCNLNEYIVFTDAAQYLAWIQYVMNV